MCPVNTTDHSWVSCRGEKQTFLPIRLPLSGQIYLPSSACTQSCRYTMNYLVLHKNVLHCTQPKLVSTHRQRSSSFAASHTLDRPVCKGGSLMAHGHECNYRPIQQHRYGYFYKCGGQCVTLMSTFKTG